MGRLMSGAMIILFVLLTNTFAAFVTASNAGTYNDSSTGSFSSGCSTAASNDTSNHADCEAASKSSFFASVFGTTFTGFSGAPVILNAAWGLTMSILLTVGVLLIVLAFIPLTAE